jgi:hypothetical protein
LLAAHLGLLVLDDLAAHRGLTLVFLMLGFIALWRALHRLRGRALPAVWLLTIALLLRLLLLPLSPTLSNDILRYLWDGRVVAAGHNPYLLPPESPELEPLRDELWDGLHHRDVPTVYPPVAMAAFTLAASVPVSPGIQILLLKILFILGDLAACAGLVYLAGRHGLSTERVAWYAWNPLVVLEVAGMGHIDALGVPWVVAAVCLLTLRSAAAGLIAGLAAAGGALAKIVPLLAIPLWWRFTQHRWRFLAGSLAGLALVLPVLVAAGGVPPGLVRYGVSWEFNGPLYEPLWRSLDALGTDRLVEGRLDGLKQTTGAHEAINRLYPLNYPQLHAKLLLGAGLGIWLLLSWRSRDLIAGTGRLFGGILLFSATLYPWYLLWALPWAALCRQPAWLLLSALMPLSYLAQGTELALFPGIYLLIWLPFAAVHLRYRQWSFD